MENGHSASLVQHGFCQEKNNLTGGQRIKLSSSSISSADKLLVILSVEKWVKSFWIKTLKNKEEIVRGLVEGKDKA